MKEAHEGRPDEEGCAAARRNRGREETARELYKALSQNDRPRARKRTGRRRPTALIEAAKKPQEAMKRPPRRLLKLANCNACHKASQVGTRRATIRARYYFRAGVHSWPARFFVGLNAGGSFAR